MVSFGCIQGGTSHNVIPEQVSLLGTIRTLSHDSADPVRDRVRQIGHGLGDATGATIEIAFGNSVDGVYQRPGRHRASACAAAAEVVGSDHVETIELPSMGGEDFAAYLAHVPGCMLRLGVASAGDGDAAAPSPHAQRSTSTSAPWPSARRCWRTAWSLHSISRRPGCR